MLRNLKINNVELNGVKFTPRKNSLNKFFSQALKIQRDFANYEEVYVDNDLVKETIRTEAEKDLDGYAVAVDKLLKQRFLCYEIFLTCDVSGNYSVVNAESLCNVMFEDCTINHSQNRNDEEFSDYLNFMVDLLRDFFLNFNPMASINVMLQKSGNNIPQETNSPKES